MTAAISQESDPFYQTESDPKKFIERYLKNYAKLYYTRKVREIEKLIGRSDLSGKNVLDIGCCGGYFSVLFAKRGASVTGIDTSVNAIKAAMYYAKQEKAACTFLHGDISVLERFGKGKRFDLILAKDVIEHIEDDNSFLQSLAGNLTPGGKAIITTQNWLSFNYFFEGAIRKMLGQKKWVGWDPTHVRWYSCWSLKKKLAAAGLRATGFSGSYYVPYEMLKALKIEPRSRIWVVLDGLFGGRWPLNRMGWSISVVGEKGKY
ncbi:methyltransferase domain-containing protein [Candidatus Woesearchaeota archaeon]|nr:methyltransferase domain-containing protein [Candidatus Woesearchaeota archaeon]